MKTRVLALVGAFMLALTFTGAASASPTTYDHPSVEVGGECGSPSLTFKNPTRYPILFKYVEDGAYGATWVTPQENYETVKFGPYEEESAHELAYKIWLPHQDWVEVEVVTDCLKDVTPLAPTAESPTCQNLLAGKITVPTVEGVVYDTESGPVAPGEYHVTAKPAEGYEFTDGAASEWHLVVNPPGDCTGQPGAPGAPGQPGQPGAPGQVITIVQPTPATPVVAQPSFTG